MFRTVDEKFGKLDILFNNAGMDLSPHRIHEMPLEDWNRELAANLTSAFPCMQEGLKLMLRQRNCTDDDEARSCRYPELIWEIPG